MVYDTVCTLRNHPTAQEVYDRLHRDHPTVSRATVYRILGGLAAQGQLLKIPIADSADHFDHNTESHVHFFCRMCGCVGDVDVAVPELLLPPENSRYLLEGYTVLYHGLCDACRRGKENK